MTDEQVFQITTEGASPAVPIDLANAGFKERDNLQEWVLRHPTILGDDVMVITSEFNRWMSYTGERQLNRFDVLALDSEGRLVLAELKRDRAPDSVHLQAVTYAALASSFSENDVVQAYSEHRSKHYEPTSVEQARNQVLEHAGELDPETLRSPRIVLVAGEFSPITTSSVVWLTEQGLDINLQRVQAYRIASGETIMTISQLYPLPAIEGFRVTAQMAEAREGKDRKRGSREASTVVRLVNEGLIPDGTQLTLVPPSQVVSAENREKIWQWLAQHPEQGRALWFNKRSTPLLWEADGNEYRPTTIVRNIVQGATEMQSVPNGPRWWQTPDGRSLPEVARSQDGSVFDWSSLHELLECIPEGRWASYGDLSVFVGTSPQPLGNHLASCTVCTNAWRVLDSRGRSSASFSWTDTTRKETQQDVLEAEGVRFSDAGQADPGVRLSAEELTELLADAE